MDQGVMTGCHQSQESFLKPWLESYKKANNFPITFCDFGMSEAGIKWCQEHGSLIQGYSKGLALSKSPYNQTVWVDINCSIKKSLQPLFEMAKVSDGFAILHRPSQKLLTGVIAFDKTSPVISNWKALCSKYQGQDENEILEEVLKKNKFDITMFSQKYHWTASQNAPENTVISLAN